MQCNNSRRCRRVMKGWSGDVEGVCHTSCGGVTDFKRYVHVYLRNSNKLHVPWQPTLKSEKRDLAAILDPQARQGVPIQPPGQVRLVELAVHEVLGSRGAYHGGGWLPWENRGVKVVTPNEFSQTMWCKRKLSYEERLQVLDVPVSVIKGLTSVEKSKLVAEPSVLPVKVLTGVCQSFLGSSPLNVATGLEPKTEIVQQHI